MHQGNAEPRSRGRAGFVSWALCLASRELFYFPSSSKTNSSEPLSISDGETSLNVNYGMKQSSSRVVGALVPRWQPVAARPWREAPARLPRLKTRSSYLGTRKTLNEAGFLIFPVPAGGRCKGQVDLLDLSAWGCRRDFSFHLAASSFPGGSVGSRGDASLQTGPRSDLCRCVEPLNSSHPKPFACHTARVLGVRVGRRSVPRGGGCALETCRNNLRG